MLTMRANLVLIANINEFALALNFKIYFSCEIFTRFPETSFQKTQKRFM